MQAGAAGSLELAPSEIERLRQLVELGRREEAVMAIMAALRCSQEHAESLVTAWAADLAKATLSRAVFGASGWVMTLLSLTLVAGGVFAIIETAPPYQSFGIAATIVGSLLCLVLLPPLLRSLRYLTATKATATIARAAHVGQWSKVSVYRVLLDVREPSGSVFRVELPLPVRKGFEERVTPGRQFWVKYFPGDTDSVVYAGKIN